MNKFLDSVTGFASNNSQFFTNHLLIPTISGTQSSQRLWIDLYFELEALTTAAGYAQNTFDALAVNGLQYTTNGGGAWTNLNASPVAAGGGLVRYSIPVAAGNYVNFRQVSGSAVYFRKGATAYLQTEPIR